jgi:hypothetical protein
MRQLLLWFALHCTALCGDLQLCDAAGWLCIKCRHAHREKHPSPSAVLSCLAFLQGRFFEDEIKPHLKHKKRGLLGMAGEACRRGVCSTWPRCQPLLPATAGLPGCRMLSCPCPSPLPALCCQSLLHLSLPTGPTACFVSAAPPLQVLART